MIQQESSLPAFPHIFIVEASAGSGKTYCLAKRYIQLLLDPELPFEELPFKNILAITFSNKAAFEMKARILEFLKKIALGQFENADEKKDILDSLGADEASVRAKASLAMSGLIRNYHFFQVQTIDSFINAILSGCAFRIGLSAVFRIRTDGADYLRLSVDRLIDQAKGEPAIRRLFQDFLMQYLRLENKTAWLPKEEIVLKMASLFAMRNSYSALFLSGARACKDVLVRKKIILKEMDALKSFLPEGTHKIFGRMLAGFLEKHRENFNTRDLSSYFAGEDIPVRKGSEVSPQAKRIWGKIRREIRHLVEEESAAAFGSYMDIFGLVLGNLRELARRDDALFLEELNKRAAEFIGQGEVTIPELYFRLATRLKHFLIDEFQDTSVLQWENLRPMVEEALSCGGSLFYVGDRKQAIYRFRGGDVALFDTVRETLGAFAVHSARLLRNFRSSKVIVEFCNRVFSQENLGRFLEAHLGKRGAAVFDPSQRREVLKVFETARQEFLPKKDAGYVRVEILDARDRQEQGDEVKKKLMILLEDLEGRLGYGSVAVLVRENKDVELVTGWLLERRIPVCSEKTLNIRNSACVKEIVSLLSFLHSPVDDLAFASFILGGIFSKASGIASCEFHDFVFEAARGRQREESRYLYSGFRRRFPREWEAFLEGALRRVGFVPTYELVTGLFETMKVFEHFASYQGYFMRLLELIKEEEQERPTLGAFLEFFHKAPDEKLYVRFWPKANAVSVLTIHKAKGLGFPAVILPFFEMNPGVDPDVVSLSREGLLLRRITEKTKIFSPFLGALWRREYLRSFIDELNAVYVALTRAQEELYVFVTEAVRGALSLSGLILPCEGPDVFEVGQRRGGRPADARETPPQFLPVSHYKEWSRLLRREFGDEAVSNRRQVLRGEVLHAVFGRIGSLRGKNAAGEMHRAIGVAQLLWGHFSDWRDIELTAGKILDDEKLKKFFDLEGTVYCEKDVTDAGGNTKRIDRLMVTQEEVWVLDYKSSRGEQESGRLQVAGYMDLARGLYPNKRVRGFLVYFDGGAFEEVAGT